MFVCKMTQSVKYVQFKGQPIELIDGYKYTNKDLIAMYPSYFVEIKEDVKEETKADVVPAVTPIPEPTPVVEVVAPEIVEEVPEVETVETVETVLTEVVVPAKKKGGRPPKVLVDNSSDVKIESSED